MPLLIKKNQRKLKEKKILNSLFPDNKVNYSTDNNVNNNLKKKLN
jgi:hypothetical protein